MQLGRAPLWAWAGHRPPGPPLPSPPLATHVLGKDHALKFGGEAPEGFQCQSMPVGHSHQEGEGAAPGVRPGRVGWPQPRLPGTPPALQAATRWLEAALTGRWPPRAQGVVRVASVWATVYVCESTQVFPRCTNGFASVCGRGACLCVCLHGCACLEYGDGGRVSGPQHRCARASVGGCYVCLRVPICILCVRTYKCAHLSVTTCVYSLGNTVRVSEDNEAFVGCTGVPSGESPCGDTGVFVIHAHKQAVPCLSPQPAAPLPETWAASSVCWGQSGPEAGPQRPEASPSLCSLLPPPSPAHSRRGGRWSLMLEWLEEQES